MEYVSPSFNSNYSMLFSEKDRSRNFQKYNGGPGKKEIQRVGSIDEQNIGNSDNIGKETIDIGKICGEL